MGQLWTMHKQSTRSSLVHAVRLPLTGRWLVLDEGTQSIWETQLLIARSCSSKTFQRGLPLPRQCAPRKAARRGENRLYCHSTAGPHLHNGVLHKAARVRAVRRPAGDGGGARPRSCSGAAGSDGAPLHARSKRPPRHSAVLDARTYNVFCLVILVLSPVTGSQGNLWRPCYRKAEAKAASGGCGGSGGANEKIQMS